MNDTVSAVTSGGSATSAGSNNSSSSAVTSGGSATSAGSAAASADAQKPPYYYVTTQDMYVSPELGVVKAFTVIKDAATIALMQENGQLASCIRIPNTDAPE